MVKTGILTFHRADNYGAVLQAYALNKKLNDLDVDAEEIDYYPDYFRKIYMMNVSFSIKHPKSLFYKIKRESISAILKKRSLGFKKFIENNFVLSRTFSQKEISTIDKLDYDIIITGSDQVWNDRCAEFDPIYFLDFPAASKVKKYSYAASFNLNKIPFDKIEEYSRRLKGYASYSVRESVGQILLKDLIGVNAVVNCDPTFLLNQNQWIELADKCNNSKIKNSQPYLFVYYVKKSKMLMEYAQKIAKQKKLQVICIPCMMTFDVFEQKLYSEYGFTFLPDASPYDFLSLIKNAQYVISNSFHGTVFSVIFHKQFYSVMNFDDGGKNLRSKQLIESLDLVDRIIDSRTVISSIDDRINWESVEKTISHEREEAIMYLKKICGLGNNE